MLGFLKRLLRKKASEQDVQALESADEALRSASKRLQAQKENLHLGIIAGYMSKTLKGIENSLVRIESQLMTKDWYKLEVEPKLLQLLEEVHKHETQELERYERLNSSIEKILEIIKEIPEPFKHKLLNEVEKLKKECSLSPKMKEVLSILEKRKEISYKELASQLNLSPSAVRSLLTQLAKRAHGIERYQKGKEGYVKFKRFEAL